ncbi:MAG TPA: mycofactocin precursor MftA [Acidimicrobiales bacterium]|nr:mycofactocin precursor MftA [Acidimicrobiales bacterium]
MPDTAAHTSVAEADTGRIDPVEEAELVEDELLVEEISIDGMCGVY